MYNGNTDTSSNEAVAIQLANTITNILCAYQVDQHTGNHLFCRLAELLVRLPNQELNQLLEGVQNGQRQRRALLDELGTTDVD